MQEQGAINRITAVERRLSVLIFCPSAVGGIAEHNHYQAKALQQLGVNVVVLCDPGYLDRRAVDYHVERCLKEDGAALPGSRLLRRVVKSWRLIYNQWRFAWEVFRRRPSLALAASYAEYLSPFWVWPHLLLAGGRNQLYAANLHDPVRDYQVGPAWWHHLSVWLAYLPLRFGLVHQRMPSPSPIPARIEVIEAPVGVYELTESRDDPLEIRNRWRVPPGKKVFLAFGFIRDNKNLDLVIRAMVDHPDAFLVVMGRAQSVKDRPQAFYLKLAEELGVSERTRFFDEFVPDEKLAGIFAAADFIVLTYSVSFLSQSGVLSVAARARRPVLASAGPSPMQDSVKKFSLGAFVEPDSVSALAEGIGVLLRGATAKPQWDDYEAYASWKVNAKIMLDAVERFHPRPAGKT
jgi:glycosyltransferase involved in cell wall biosynthesis